MDSKYIKINDRKIFYVEEGKGRPLILIHGWASNWYCFSRLFKFLSNNFHLYAIDLLGYGKSDKPDIIYTIPLFVKTINSFIKSLEINEKIILLGHSLGGQICINFCYLFPELIEKMVLISPAGMKGIEGINSFFASIHPIIDVGVLFNNRFFIEMALKFFVFFDKFSLTEQYLNELAEPLLSNEGRKTLSNITKNCIGKTPVDSLLKEIDVPVLIIWGKNDNLLKSRWAIKYQKNIKGSKLVIIDECGHEPMWEKPEETVKFLFDFL